MASLVIFNRSSVVVTLLYPTASVKSMWLLREQFGEKYPFPKWSVPFFLVWLFGPILGFSHEYVEKNIGVPVKFDNSYTQNDLGIKFTDIKQTVCDHFDQLLRDGIIKKNQI